MDFGYHHNYDYGYANAQGMPDSVFNAVLAIVMIVAAVGLMIKLAAYIIHSYGLYRIADRLGVKHPWLAFLPYARDYLYGEVSGDIPLKKKTIKKPGIWKLLLPVAAGAILPILYFVPGFLLGLGATLAETVGAVGGSLVLSAVALFVFMGVCYLLYLAVYKVLCVLIDIQIYSRFTTGNMPVVHAVLSAVVPLYGAVCMMVMCGRPFLSEEEDSSQ